MLVTVTNLSTTITLNAPDTGLAGVSPDAVGGNVRYKLPYPFSHIGPLAPSASKQLPMHMEDWAHKSVPWLPLEPSTEWKQLIQAGLVSMAFAAEARYTDPEDVMTSTLAVPAGP